MPGTYIYSLPPPGSDEDPTPVDGFTGAFIFKEVPVAIRGSYDPKTDPAQTPNPAELRNPDNPTMTLATGVTVKAPDANKSMSNVAPFDPATNFVEPIGPFTMEKTRNTQSEYLSSAVQYPSNTPADRWQHVQDEWREIAGAGTKVLGGSVGNGVQSDGMLKMAAQYLKSGVKMGNPSNSGAGSIGVGGTASWMLNPTPPTILIDELTSEYSVLPRLSV